MGRKNILLDMDGVLNKFGGDFITWVIDHYPKAQWDEQYGYDMCNWFTIDGERRKDIRIEVFNDVSFWRDLTLNQRLNDELIAMDTFNKHNTYVCTLPFGWTFCPTIKEAWLNKYYPQLNTKTNLIMTGEKHLMANEAILIDDSPDNVKKFMEAGGEAYLYETFYNYAEDLPKIKSLHELEGYI